MIRQALAGSDPKDDFARNRVAYMHVKLANRVREDTVDCRKLSSMHAPQSRCTNPFPTTVDEIQFADVLWTIGRLEQTMARRIEACAAY